MAALSGDMPARIIELEQTIDHLTRENTFLRNENVRIQTAYNNVLGLNQSLVHINKELQDRIKIVEANNVRRDAADAQRDQLIAQILARQGAANPPPYEAPKPKSIFEALALLTEPEALAAVQTDAWKFRYLSEACRNNPDILRAALTKSAEMFQHASERLRGDKPIALIAVRQLANNFWHVSPKLKGDIELARIAIITKGVSLSAASDSLKDNEEFVLELVESRPRELQFASNRLKDSRVIVLTAVRKVQDLAVRNKGKHIPDDRAFEYASPRLQKDYSVLIASGRMTPTPHNTCAVS